MNRWKRERLSRFFKPFYCTLSMSNAFVYVYNAFMYVLLFKYIFLLINVVFNYHLSFGRFSCQVLAISFFTIQFIENSKAACCYICAIPNTRDLPAQPGLLLIVIIIFLKNEAFYMSF